MEREMANLVIAVVNVRLHDFFLSTYTDLSSFNRNCLYMYNV